MLPNSSANPLPDPVLASCKMRQLADITPFFVLKERFLGGTQKISLLSGKFRTLAITRPHRYLLGSGTAVDTQAGEFSYSTLRQDA